MTSTPRKTIGRPRKGDELRARVSLRLDAALLRDVDAAAAEAGRSRTEYVEEALRERVSGATGRGKAE